MSALRLDAKYASYLDYLNAVDSGKIEELK